VTDTAADVVVAGAGPAGASAALWLERAGRRVILCDKARFPRDKFCGDALTTGALRLLDELGFDPGSVPSWQRVDDVIIRSPSGRTVELPMPADAGQYAVVARRLDLDNSLVELARKRGVEIREQCPVTSVEPLDDRIIVGTPRGRIHARYLIAADGMWSPVRKLLGLTLEGYRGDSHAFRQYYKGVGPRAADALHIWFEPDIIPGYAWSFPLAGGRANVGFGIVRATHRTGEMAELWPDLLARPHIRAVLGPNAEPEAPHRAWPIPARMDQIALTAQRTLFVGDAAAVTDPMTGEGIAQALLTGKLAAAAVASRPNSPDLAQEAYEQAVRSELLPDFHLAQLLGHLLRSEKGARGAVRAAGLTPWTRRHFVRWLFEDYPRAAVLTPHRWRTDMFSREGAFG
jgi:geranylgeranyl reductase family protein